MAIKPPFKQQSWVRRSNRPSGSNCNKNVHKGRERKVMPVELSDEQPKNQIKETLEKLTSKGGKI